MRQFKLSLLIVACLLWTSCEGNLSRSFHQDVAREQDRLREANRQLGRIQDTVWGDLTKNPDWFRGVSVGGDWTTTLRTAKEKLERAKQDGVKLEKLVQLDRGNSRAEGERTLAEERTLREQASQQSSQVESAANQWLSFGQNPASNLTRMEQEYKSLRSTDLDSVAKTVEGTEKDWPIKKVELDRRLTALRDSVKTATVEWDNAEAVRQVAAGGKLDGQQIEKLVHADDVLSEKGRTLKADSDNLRAMCGQLYNSWDKVLTDLDSSQYGARPVYRERIKTVQTHFTDVSAHKSETSSDEHWANISEPSYRALENNLGMTIAHKDPGLFDSEADNTPQPAGFAYIAPPFQGGNQYGYWTHTDHGTIWTFLPQYLLMRELLWNRDYRPVVLDDFNGYRTARSAGRIYYGQQTPASPPQYGTHGTFTQTRYAQSRYAQAGGFKSSSYASHPESASTPSFNRSPSSKPSGSFGSAGKRFGSPSGQRFGQSSGSRGMGGGRSFGRRR